MKNIKIFKPLLSYLKQYKKKLILILISVVIVELLELLYGYLNGMALEELTKKHLMLSIIYLLCYFMTNYVFGVLLYDFNKQSLKKIELEINNKISKEIFSKTLDLPAIAFEQTTSGNIINRITSDVSRISEDFWDIIDMIISTFGSLLVLIYIFYNSYIVALEIIFFMIMIFLIIRKFNPIIKKIDENIKKENDKYVSSVNEDIRGIREIKTLGVKEHVFMSFNDLCNSLTKLRKEGVSKEIIYDIIISSIRCFVEVFTFIICGILYIKKMVPLSFYVAMTYYVYRYTYMIDRLSNFSVTYQKMVVSMKRINEVVDNELYKDEPFGDKIINNCEGKLEIKNVSFGYDGKDNILNNLNLTINPNEKIAIVGKSGEGKSTIFNLITKLFNPITGNIYLDGENINNISEFSLRKYISIIRQDPFIFNMTIKDNFKMIDPNITLKEIREYTKLAFIDDYIMGLPNKYNTIIGEGGINLSGGQKQRLAIARTLARKSKIILFDEATSALDNESQKYIKQTIDNLAKDHTIIIVAHRFSTILDADCIYVINNGKIVASGTHQELLKTNDIYKNLFKLEKGI